MSDRDYIRIDQVASELSCLSSSLLDRCRVGELKCYFNMGAAFLRSNMIGNDKLVLLSKAHGGYPEKYKYGAFLVKSSPSDLEWLRDNCFWDLSLPRYYSFDEGISIWCNVDSISDNVHFKNCYFVEEICSRLELFHADDSGNRKKISVGEKYLNGLGDTLVEVRELRDKYIRKRVDYLLQQCPEIVRNSLLSIVYNAFAMNCSAEEVFNYFNSNMMVALSNNRKYLSDQHSKLLCQMVMSLREVFCQGYVELIKFQGVLYSNFMNRTLPVATESFIKKVAYDHSVPVTLERQITSGFQHDGLPLFFNEFEEISLSTADDLYHKGTVDEIGLASHAIIKLNTSYEAYSNNSRLLILSQDDIFFRRSEVEKLIFNKEVCKNNPGQTSLTVKPEIEVHGKRETAFTSLLRGIYKQVFDENGKVNSPTINRLTYERLYSERDRHKILIEVPHWGRGPNAIVKWKTVDMLHPESITRQNVSKRITYFKKKYRLNNFWFA